MNHHSGNKNQAILARVFCSLFIGVLLLVGCGATQLVPPSTNGQPPTSRPVPTAITSKGSVQFIVFGDSGSAMRGQIETANQMAQLYNRKPFSFALMLGDNIYEVGDVNKLGEARFLNPYKALLASGVRFYPAFGNHDLAEGHDAEQLEFFDMPGPYYDFVIGNVHFLAIDTTRFDKLQAQWLDKKLAQSKSTWNIVYGHHPVYSSGAHGNTQLMINLLKPVLEKHRVNMYLAGHDHDYERFNPIRGVVYIVSGGGGASLRKFKKIKPGSVVRHVKNHFMHVEIKGRQVRFRVIDGKGNMIDSFQWAQPQSRPVKNTKKPAA